MCDIVRPMTADDLRQVWLWRTHPDINSMMVHQEPIDFEDHRRWFEATVVREDAVLLIFELDGEPTGFVNFSIAGQSAEWGFYLAPDSKSGTGKRLGAAALFYAFSDLGLDCVLGEVLAFNELSYHFHLRMGFTELETVPNKYVIAGRSVGAVQFKLTNTDWHRLYG